MAARMHRLAKESISGILCGIAPVLVLESHLLPLVPGDSLALAIL